MDEKLDSRRSQYFMQVIRTGSVRGAAEVLNMDPSAISRAVAALEVDCGIALLERRGRGVVATEAGLVLAAHLKRRQNNEEHFFAEIDGLRHAERGHVDLLVGEGFIELLIANVLRDYWRTYPQVTLDIDVARTTEIAQRIIDGSAYIGMVFEPPADARLHTHYSRPEPLRAIVRRDHPLTRLRDPLTLADLMPYPGATMQEGFGVRQHVQAAEISEQVRLRNVLTTSSFKALWQFAATGIGYALMPTVAIAGDLDSHELVALPMQNVLLNQGGLHVVSRAGRPISPAARALLEHIVRGLTTVSAGSTPRTINK